MTHDHPVYSEAIAGGSFDRKEKAEGREKEGRGCGRRRGRGAEVDGEVTVGRRREVRRME